MWQGVAEDWGKGAYRDVPICKWAKLARERHKRDLKRSQNEPDYPYYFDEKAADHVIWFFKTQLRHSKGRKFAGQPFIPDDWQEWDILRPLFGWKRKSDNTRRFRRFFIFIPRKNGKSTLIAGIGLYLLVADMEPGGEIYCAATKEAQAKIVWNEAKNMVRKSPLLKEEVTCFAKSLFCEELGSVMRPLGRDSKTEDGLNVHGGLIDEYHAHKTNEMLSVLETATGSRDQPLIGIITTAGLEAVCPCREEQEYGQKILEGTIENDEYFVYITTVDDPEDWKNPIEWQKANPGWGISVGIDDFYGLAKKAEEIPSQLPSFLSKKLNVWADKYTTWIPTSDYAACEIDFNEEDYLHKPCFLGLDFSSTNDITAASLVFPVEQEFHVLPHFWVPAESIRRRSRDEGIPYETWSRGGFIEETSGAIVDHDRAREWILEQRAKFNILEIGMDPWNAIQLMTQLEANRFKVIPVRQGYYSLSGPTKEADKLIRSRRLKFAKNPAAAWQISNVMMEQDAAGNIKPSKERSKDKIDFLISLICGLDRALRRGVVASVYEKRGLLTL